MEHSLFNSYEMNGLQLSNRMVMAPLSRCRATSEGLVTALMQEYYSQRSSAGLIISESLPVSAQGVGYPLTPGIYSREQAQSWKVLTSGLHEKGTKIFAQLQHCGRISHSSMQTNSELPISASSIKPTGQAVTYQGYKDFEAPRALKQNEIPSIVLQYIEAAKLAKEAGFDGIEIHGANGYLIDQFLRDGVNSRTDKYGGNIKNRMRLLNEILDSVTEIWGSDKVGIRLSPENTFNDMFDSNPQTHFDYIVEQLNARNLAYLHVLEGDMMKGKVKLNYQALRKRFDNTYIANNGYNLNTALYALSNKNADLIAFGSAFLANPDLVRRFKEGLPLNSPDHETYYAGGAKGYVDYPFYNEAMVREEPA